MLSSGGNSLPKKRKSIGKRYGGPRYPAAGTTAATEQMMLTVRFATPPPSATRLGPSHLRVMPAQMGSIPQGLCTMNHLSGTSPGCGGPSMGSSSPSPLGHCFGHRRSPKTISSAKERQRHVPRSIRLPRMTLRTQTTLSIVHGNLWRTRIKPGSAQHPTATGPSSSDRPVEVPIGTGLRLQHD